MTIGTSDRRQFPDEMSYLLGKENKSEDDGPITQNIDREHHVPLVASALTDEDGKMYGMAIDHRIPSKPEYEKHLWNHEAYENEYMNDLVKIGYSSQDAYHKAHDWSTARESAAVEAEFGKQGLEDYKQHWRDAASIAAEPTDRERHPDAHTTKHGLDESELGKKFAQLQTAYETPQERSEDYKEKAKESSLGGAVTIEHKPFHPLSILGAPPIADLSDPASMKGVQQIDTGLMGNPPIAPKLIKKESEEKEREMEDTLELPDEAPESLKERFRRMQDLIEHIRVRPIESGGRIRHKKRAVN